VPVLYLAIILQGITLNLLHTRASSQDDPQMARSLVSLRSSSLCLVVTSPPKIVTFATVVYPLHTVLLRQEVALNSTFLLPLLNSARNLLLLLLTVEWWEAPVSHASG
jgi:hypothetical protein